MAWTSCASAPKANLPTALWCPGYQWSPISSSQREETARSVFCVGNIYSSVCLLLALSLFRDLAKGPWIYLKFSGTEALTWEHFITPPGSRLYRLIWQNADGGAWLLKQPLTCKQRYNSPTAHWPITISSRGRQGGQSLARICAHIKALFAIAHFITVMEDTSAEIQRDNKKAWSGVLTLSVQ